MEEHNGVLGVGIRPGIDERSAVQNARPGPPENLTPAADYPDQDLTVAANGQLRSKIPKMKKCKKALSSVRFELR